MQQKIIKVQNGILFAIAADGKSGLVADFNDQPDKLNWSDATEGLENDWRLPTKNELNLLYEQREGMGGFAPDFYWSSSEGDSGSAWSQYFSNGDRYCLSRDFAYLVRAVKDVTFNHEAASTP